MGKGDTARKREQRLAAKLRENLKRRKEQARSRAASQSKPDSGMSSAEAVEPPLPLKPDTESDS